MMRDTAQVTAIACMIAASATEEALVAVVAQLFPHLTTAELSAALQVAQAAAEQQASRRH